METAGRCAGGVCETSSARTVSADDGRCGVTPVTGVSTVTEEEARAPQFVQRPDADTCALPQRGQPMNLRERRCNYAAKRHPGPSSARRRAPLWTSLRRYKRQRFSNRTHPGPTFRPNLPVIRGVNQPARRATGLRSRLTRPPRAQSRREWCRSAGLCGCLRPAGGPR